MKVVELGFQILQSTHFKCGVRVIFEIKLFEEFETEMLPSKMADDIISPDVFETLSEEEANILRSFFQNALGA